MAASTEKEIKILHINNLINESNNLVVYNPVLQRPSSKSHGN